jgi:hypothetical protein
MLASDQVQAVKEIKNWWNSSKAFYTLNGSAGVGKSFVVDSLLKELPRVAPVLLAPTHKALRQLREKTKGDYEYRTVANALGIRPVDEGKELTFEHIKLPGFWDDVNLAIVDEAGMLDDFHIELFKSIGTKILYVGHKSQLPPVRLNRSIFDTCISPVFEQGYGESNLFIPKRNKGRLWEFNNSLEAKIYDDKLPISGEYDVTESKLKDYVNSSENSFKAGLTKIALWTNDGVDKYNRKIRELLFKGDAKLKYVKDDLIILTNTIISFDGMEYLNDREILKFAKIGKDIYTDTDGRVISCEKVKVNLNKSLSVSCLKIVVTTTLEGKLVFYELCYKEDYKKIADFYEHKAWSFISKEAKDKAYKERATILKCFASTKPFYAATSHRLQGSSISNIIAIASNINLNSNRVERSKCMYVACSRASENLLIYRGI